MFGRKLDERLASGQFWTLFIGFSHHYFPMHILVLMGKPRRVYDYPADRGWTDRQNPLDRRRRADGLSR